MSRQHNNYSDDSELSPRDAGDAHQSKESAVQGLGFRVALPSAT